MFTTTLYTPGMYIRGLYFPGEKGHKKLPQLFEPAHVLLVHALNLLLECKAHFWGDAT